MGKPLKMDITPAAPLPPELPQMPPTAPWKRRLRLAGIIAINGVLVAMIIGLLLATWMPAYIFKNPQIEIGETRSK
ncbi:MAG TPA: hypothetical protein VGN72_23245 [Tepidisphaeraceae bacterium]|jgi:hypothetical protein|nr:hypothetical protein [Tepidisphaeraceae bacterium]